jgi:hypothetical protein
MKTRLTAWLILWLASGLAGLGCASSGGAGAATAPGEGPKTTGSVTELTAMLSGRFQGSTPGNELTLDVSSTPGRLSGTVFNLFVTASGRYQDRNIREVGILRIEEQGRDISATYIPHFDSTVTALSPGANRFTANELSAACNFYFSPQGDGYLGETRGGVDCVQAIRGATGKWVVEVEPGAIRLQSSKTGETLRFKKAA